MAFIRFLRQRIIYLKTTVESRGLFNSIMIFLKRANVDLFRSFKRSRQAHLSRKHFYAVPSISKSNTPQVKHKNKILASKTFSIDIYIYKYFLRSGMFMKAAHFILSQMISSRGLYTLSRGCHKTTFKILFLILCYGIKNSEYDKHSEAAFIPKCAFNKTAISVIKRLLKQAHQVQIY